MKEKLQRVKLDGDSIVFRVVENGLYVDRVFVRDVSQPRQNNCWVQLKSYKELTNLELLPLLQKVA